MQLLKATELITEEEHEEDHSSYDEDNEENTEQSDEDIVTHDKGLTNSEEDV